MKQKNEKANLDIEEHDCYCGICGEGFYSSRGWIHYIYFFIILLFISIWTFFWTSYGIYENVIWANALALFAFPLTLTIYPIIRKIKGE